MKITRMIAISGLAAALMGCVQVGPADDTPIHIVMDVNIRIQIDRDVQEVWDTVEAMAKGTPVKDTGAADAQDKKALEKAMADRFPAISVLKQNSKLGETWKGYLAGLEGVDLSEEVVAAGKKMTLQVLIDTENADRKALYTIIAKERSTEDQPVTADFVGERSGQELFKNRLNPGEWFQKKDGKWVQKPKRR
jgi:uncharacterized protein YdbL (DUF1318 family)